jgi:predicted alpha/beta superfamily hydrolase
MMRAMRCKVLACGLLFVLPWLAHAAAATAPGDAACTPVMSELHLVARAFAPEKITVDIYLPGDYATNGKRRYPVLYDNDGQDMPMVGLVPTLHELCRARAIEPLIVVAIHTRLDRLGTYGLSDRASARSLVGGSAVGPIGRRAYDYSDWVATQLVPFVDGQYRTEPRADARTILGWSLGGLNAFNLGWDYPEVFGRVGAFSPSFWLAADRSSANAVEHTRLAQAMVDKGARHPGQKFWFAAGTAEETNDRDHDGVIDVIGDIRDLAEGYRGADGFRQRGLRQLGYSVNMDYAGHPSRTADVSVYLLPDGKHSQDSWGQMLPLFLRWDYGTSSSAR